MVNWTWIGQHWKEAFYPATWSNWALVIVGALAAFAALRTLTTIQRQAVSMRRQTTILRDSVEVARKGSKAALLNARAVVNAERAWVMAELGWYPHSLTKIGFGSSGGIEAFLMLTCHNEGKTPAWIENISARMDIVTERIGTDDEGYSRYECGRFGPMEPIGGGNEKSRSLALTCDGTEGTKNHLSIFVIIDYRDIFGNKRETSVGYSLDLHGNLNRQNALPKRNRNT